MENSEQERIIDIPSYIKRPDLRTDEFPLMDSVQEEIENWKLIVSDLELNKELMSKGRDPLEAVTCLGLSIYPEIHGGIPHPVDILSYFCSCHEWGVFPPSWVMNELYQRFLQYIVGNQSGNDKRRLGEFFGEPPGGNQSPFFRKRVFSGVMESAFIAIDRLRLLHNLSKEDAIGVVSRRLEMVQNKTSHKFKKGEAALEKQYKAWSKECSAHLRETLSKRPPDQENTLLFLKSFPPDAFIGYPHIEALLKK